MNLYTLGYQGFTPETFIARLKAAGVRRVVDVREIPLSRKRGFSKTALAEALRAAGIGYTHLKSLGCPKPVRERLKQGGSWARYQTDFSRHLAQHTEALDELLRIARDEPVSLLCFEADYVRCHRSLVAQAAAQRGGGLKVVHLQAAKTKNLAPELRVSV